MNKSKSILEKIFYDNKILMVFCVILSVLFWAAVKINYSEKTYRTLSDVKIAIVNTVEENSEIVAFVDEEELLCDVQVKGKSYDIDSYSLSKEDIVVEASGTFVDSAGYKVLTLSAKSIDAAASIEITKITPSQITVYYDRKTTRSFNVEAKLKNELDTLVDGEYVVGQPVPSMSTVDVTGPATVINSLQKVYFEAEIAQTALPLISSKDVPAEISFELENEKEAGYLVCEGINSESNPATVTVPVYLTKEVETAASFVNQPPVYADGVKNVSVSPAMVTISYNPTEEQSFDVLNVGSIDFSNISNKVNEFEFPVNEKLGVSLTDKSIEKFVVSVDMSAMSSLVTESAPTKVVFLNKDENYTYDLNFESSPELQNITVIGPAASLQKISADDLQIEINVSSLNVNARMAQNVEISNISIQSEGVDDCWVYGKYNAVINVNPKQ